MRARRAVRIFRRHGIVYPWRTYYAAKRAGLGLALAAAVLDKESGGGHNVFGHDPVKCGPVGGAVTKDRYLAYKKNRPSCGMQGVGPVQLTYYTLQDWADAKGGCWRPYVNMLVGFSHLRMLIHKYGDADGIRRYNGLGPAAEAYSRWVRDRAAVWRQRLRAS